MRYFQSLHQLYADILANLVHHFNAINFNLRYFGDLSVIHFIKAKANPKKIKNKKSMLARMCCGEYSSPRNKMHQAECSSIRRAKLWRIFTVINVQFSSQHFLINFLQQLTPGMKKKHPQKRPLFVTLNLLPKRAVSLPFLAENKRVCVLGGSKTHTHTLVAKKTTRLFAVDGFLR